VRADNSSAQLSAHIRRAWRSSPRRRR
jgi:hypothetical protein